MRRRVFRKYFNEEHFPYFTFVLPVVRMVGPLGTTIKNLMRDMVQIV